MQIGRGFQLCREQWLECSVGTVALGRHGRRRQRRIPMDLILIIIVVVLLFGGGGYWGRRRGHW
jgi:hypothetical protein